MKNLNLYFFGLCSQLEKKERERERKGKEKKKENGRGKERIICKKI